MIIYVFGLIVTIWLAGYLTYRVVKDFINNVRFDRD